MARIVRIEALQDDDAILAREVLTLSAILAVALALVALIPRFA